MILIDIRVCRGWRSASDLPDPLPVIALMLRDRMEWDCSQEYIQSCVYGNDCIVKKSLISLRRIRANLVVMNSTILKQWEDELSETTLKYVNLNRRKRVDQLDPDE